MKFLLTPADIEEHRGMIIRLLTPVVEHAGRGEFTVDDLIQLARDGRAYIGISYAPEICGAFEFRHYPQSVSVNIIALGGEGLAELADLWFETFKKWAFVAGATSIEASCSRAMARILKRIGFANEYEVVRLKIEES
ncbi:Hypothetical protein HEAR2271 [Herminiimonas arsenicoxydans]|uniref:N-acetyltransferase domain-containing protein n=1 Tax=Herminiimonas arsenicoxydans TaxID=204773 RepID=A4G7B7_HERAR|nr:Hypothetical protein HEAR2271 [Herminiimonas arsenicoxydans]